MAQTTVLLVDDDPDSVAVYRAMLAHRGYRVLVATNGRAAVDIAREELPDLILMDLWMPVLDGWSAMRELRSDPVTANVVIIALTAHVQQGVDARALEEGFDGFLAKPIEPGRVVEEVIRRVGLPT